MTSPNPQKPARLAINKNLFSLVQNHIDIANQSTMKYLSIPSKF